MRTLFYEYPHDQNAWNIEDTYLFGDAILVAPIENYKETSREVYLQKVKVGQTYGQEKALMVEKQW